MAKPENKSRVIDAWWKVALYDPTNFFLYLLFGGEKKFRRRIIKYTLPEDGMSFLDIGCATGGNALAALVDTPFKLKVYGLDAAYNIVRTAKDKLPQTENLCCFIQGLAENLPFKDNSVDRVVNVFLMHHLNYKTKVAALKEMRRVLSDKGVLVIVDPTKPYNILGRALCFTRRYVPEIRDSIKMPLSELVKEGGFKNVEVLKNALGCFSFVRARKG